jgi:hypothetical protein
MGDRTTVTLTVLMSQVDEAKRIIENNHSEHAEFEVNGVEFIDLIFNDVNYGDLNRGTKLLDMLMHGGIAFNSRWDSGSEYGPGCEYGRFTEEGESVRLEISDSEVNPELNRLLELIDDYQALKAYIQEHAAERTPLPWENQEEYGKLYRATKLITS